MKKYILILSPFFIFVILVLLLTFTFSKNNKQNLPNFAPTPTLIIQKVSTKTQSINLISTSPSDRETNVPTNSSIIFEFDRSVANNELTFKSIPAIDFSINIQDKKIYLIPKQLLEQNTLYYFVVQSKWSNKTFSTSFMTLSSNPTPQSNITGTYMGSGEDNTLQTMDQLELNEHPDIYLNNRCPHSGDNFSVSSDFADTVDPHYYFTVILTGNNTNLAKNNFFNWALSTGLSKLQIEHLDIRYQ